MKIVILCGGLGTRFWEETKIKPKPMLKIGKLPILHHIMNLYYKSGYNDFIIALGYKGDYIKKYFKNTNHKFKLKLINTGQNTMTGGRLLRLKKYLNKDNNFMLTYGDGLADINIKKLLKQKLNKLTNIKENF